MKMFALSTAFLSAVAFAAAIYGQNVGDASISVEPDEAIQRLLHLLCKEPPESRAVKQVALADLLRIVGESHPQFVRQAIIYEATAEPHELSAYYFFLDARLTPSDIAAGIAPLLYSPTERVRRQAHCLFPQVFDQFNTSGHAGLSHLAGHITGPYQDPALSMPLKRALFESASMAACFFHQ